MSIDSHSTAFASPAARADGRTNLIGLSRPELAALLEELGEAPFRAGQLWRWLYRRGASDFTAMTDLGKTLRAKLAERCVVDRPGIASEQLSRDGTRKWLLAMVDGQKVESVHIPETERGTLCISSQVGCTLTCRFCHTGTQPLVRNLGPAEIAGQLMLARDVLKDWYREGDERAVTNVVLMGMGEPLYNYDNVARAVKVITDGDGLAISRRRVTLSTAGVVPQIRRCGEELGVSLAISLHAVTDELRDRLVPLNKRYPIRALLAACREYPGLNNARRITFEYVMLDGVNDSPADARELVRLLRGIPAKVNLIPFNPWPGSAFACSSPAAIDRFADILMNAGYASPIRTPRGQDILAACGQLRSESRRRPRHERRAELHGPEPAIAGAVSA
ncbi:MAG: 23S rRNA (adenine(2503)-C(2))-methyltransferase RlmN [Alphaproteobacteria bacterium]|jgi:23S rRNA (adenine2503-C2)-methyltransferase|nr:23S rRNA (adenine(2503)-C(2))-methyltransferase RlmN [Alphaproteobacteria bacterium]